MRLIPQLRYIISSIVIAVLVSASLLMAQDSASPAAVDCQHMHQDGMTMPMGAPAPQFASGTSWLPASSPQFMWMKPVGGWTVMAHGELFVGYNQQGGRLGVGKLESENWLMVMEQRRLGGATLEGRQMLSAEPLTAPHPGYPELFQTGETYRGEAW